jgi:hypothetical protein
MMLHTLWGNMPGGGVLGSKGAGSHWTGSL